MPGAEDVDVVKTTRRAASTFCASAPAAPGVNTTYSAVRLTHLPTGIVMVPGRALADQEQGEAMRVLKARIIDAERERKEAAYAADRKKMVGSGDRSRRSAPTTSAEPRDGPPHRVHVPPAADILDGRLDEAVDPLVAHFQAEKLKQEPRG